MQYMRSAEAAGDNVAEATAPSAATRVADTGTVDDDRTARARIRDAAIELFADSGVAGTSIRAIAALADVSPALVMHHFGSKDDLRVACDQYAAATIRSGKTAAMSAGLNLDPIGALRQSAETSPVLRYLARTLVDTSAHVAELVDELVDDAVTYTEQGVAAGVLKPSAYPRERAVLLTVWSLGALVLHEHVTRLLGVDITTDLSDEQAARRYVLPALEIHSNGTITEEMAERFRVITSSTERQRPS